MQRCDGRMRKEMGAARAESTSQRGSEVCKRGMQRLTQHKALGQAAMLVQGSAALTARDCCLRGRGVTSGLP